MKKEVKTYANTKIVATIGPASEKPETLKQMFEEGLTVCRLNFSHGSHEEHGARIATIKKLSKTTNRPVAILQDLCGPKIRLGAFENDFITLEEGDSFILTTKEMIGNEKMASVSIPSLPQDVEKGTIIKVDDGKRQLVVEKVKSDEIHCKVVVGGVFKSKKGINIPGRKLSISVFTEKDKKDAIFGISQGVDYVALSFVQEAKDIETLRTFLKKRGSNAEIISKIETTEALENLEEIIIASDAVMVARGDMAIEVGFERVPLIQKQIITMCNKLGKPVITATQMLESMEQAPVPTRAEVSDIANAVMDGTDAIMLSGESAAGKFPVEAIKVMQATCKNVEAYYNTTLPDQLADSQSVVDAVTCSVAETAYRVDATAIVALTETGFTARMISRFKPNIPVYAITPHEEVVRKMMLSYGVSPVLYKKYKGVPDVIKNLHSFIVENKLAQKDEKVVVSTGLDFAKKGSTNTMMVVEV